MKDRLSPLSVAAHAEHDELKRERPSEAVLAACAAVRSAVRRESPWLYVVPNEQR